MMRLELSWLCAGLSILVLFSADGNASPRVEAQKDPAIGEAPICLPPSRMSPPPLTKTGPLPEPSLPKGDVTPPTFPANLQVFPESIHSVFFRWDAADDPESGIDYYAFGIGSSAGSADIRWWQSTAQNLRASISPSELGLGDGSALYVTVRAYNGSGLTTEVSSSEITLAITPLGLPTYDLGVEFADWGFDTDGSTPMPGWTATEAAEMQSFVDRMVPIIKSVYGAPSHDYTVTVVKNLRYSSTNIFIPSLNEIHTDGFYPQLFTHELIHAFRDNVVITMDQHWRYDPLLSGFEESFAQGVSYECMNVYASLYPTDPATPPGSIFGSSHGWDYDFQNVDALTSGDFWSAGGGTGLAWARYETGAAAVEKVLLEQPGFAAAFNAEYYDRLEADPTLRPTRDLARDILAQVVPSVEGLPTVDWVDRQRVFDCSVQTGRKIWARTQHYPWTEYLIFHTIYYYETMSCGSEWACYLNGAWVYHGLNGATGTGTLRDGAGAVIWQKSLLVEPTDNPPAYFGFGNEKITLSTDDDTLPWPGGDPADFVLGLHDLQLYELELSFGSEQQTLHRIVGDPLRTTTGVYGAVLNGDGGVIYLDHEDYAPQAPLAVVGGVFSGPRAWASIRNAVTGYHDTDPGRVTVRYVDAGGMEYTAQRNVGYGSARGNQVFLFDATQMTPVVVSAPLGKPTSVVLGRAHPNPSSARTTVSYFVPADIEVTLRVFDLRGRVVQSLEQGIVGPGWQTVAWDGSNLHGRPVSSGTYYFCLEIGDAVWTEAFSLVR